MTDINLTIEEAVAVLNANEHRGHSTWRSFKGKPTIWSCPDDKPCLDIDIPDALIVAAWYQQRTQTNGVDLEAIVAGSNQSRRRQDQEKLFPSLAEALRRESERVKELEVELAALRTPAVGTWQWALEQLEAEGALTRRIFSGNPYIRLERGTFRMYHRASGMMTVWDASHDDIVATDWQLAEEPKV